MRQEKIDGIGTMLGGEYDEILVDGIGKLKGNAKAKKVVIDGLFKGKGTIEADEITIDGLSRQYKDIRAKEIKIDGVLKLRGASLYADHLICDGVLVCTDEVNADHVTLKGLCSLSRLYGDQIHIHHQSDQIVQEKLPKAARSFSRLYFGRPISTNHALVDTIECTYLRASGLKSDVIRANKLDLSHGCEVDIVYCDGDISIDDTCQVKKIIKNQQQIEISSVRPDNKNKEKNQMNNENISKILDSYKNNTITIDEARTMLEAMMPADQEKPSAEKTSYSSVTDWPDDNTVRVAVFRGRTLLKKGDPNSGEISLKLDGDAADVECAGNITCRQIESKATAGGNINCERIDGNVTCGGNVYCEKIDGNIKAGGGVHLGRNQTP